jgi:hypothetical protein
MLAVYTVGIGYGQENRHRHAGRACCGKGLAAQDKFHVGLTALSFRLIMMAAIDWPTSLRVPVNLSIRLNQWSNVDEKADGCMYWAWPPPA